MAQLFTLPKAIPLSSTGGLLAGAKLYFYITGTSTAKDTYTDVALSVPSTNPVVASAYGVFAPIFMAVDVRYRVTLKTSAGVLIYTVDDVGGPLLTQSQWGQIGSPITDAETSAAITPTNYEVPSHDVLGYVLATRYGFSDSATGATNKTALANAHAVAVVAGCAVHLPSGIFPYTPTAVLTLTQDLICEGQCRLDCSMTSYSGVVLQQTGSTVIRGLYLNRTGTQQGTGLKQEAADQAEFTGHQYLDRVWIIGFSTNLFIGNTYHQLYNKCRIGSASTRGVSCVPYNNSGSNGMVNAHTWLECEFLGNVQNVVYYLAVIGNDIQFIGCSDEGATRATASTFTSCQGLSFRGHYCEGTNTIKALALNSCQVKIDQMYLNGTAGISIGTNTTANFSGVSVGSSTDLLTGADGTQTVSIDQSIFYTYGNSATTDWANFSATGSSYNNVSYKAFFTDLSTGVTDDGYSASITPSLRFGNTLRYTVNNGTAFTINAPILMGKGSMLRIILKNTSGGAMGAVTLNAVFKAPTLTLPATGFNRTYTFQYDGTNWIFQYQTASDVPN